MEEEVGWGGVELPEASESLEAEKSGSSALLGFLRLSSTPGANEVTRHVCHHRHHQKHKLSCHVQNQGKSGLWFNYNAIQ